MIRTKQPPRGAFDYMLHPVDQDAWRDTGLEPPPNCEPPKEPEGRRQRVTVNIEINQRHAGQRAPVTHRGIGVLGWIILLLMLLCVAAHAQPSNWTSYQSGHTTHYQGYDQDGGAWTGRQYKQGFTTYSDFYGPDEQVKHCRSYKQGFTVHSECD